MHRGVVLLIVPMLALVAVGCGSDEASTSSGPADTASSQPAVTGPAVTEPVVTEPVTTERSASTDPVSTEPATVGIEVDDDPVCQAFARVFAAQFFQGLAGAFGGGEGASEKIELYFAPALAPDVVVIRTQGAPEFQPFPTLARLEAATIALTAGGFTQEEQSALATSGNDPIDAVLSGREPGEDSVAVAPEAEAKLSTAAETFLADVGTVDEFFQAEADPEAEAAFTAALSATCPILVASFESL